MRLSFVDTLCVINLVITVLWTIPYLLWQFEKIDGEEETWKRIISFANAFETVVLIVAHVGQPGTWGTVSLGVFYGISIVTLFLQLIYADSEVVGKFGTIFWLIFYILFFAVDVLGADISEFAAQVPLVKWLSDRVSTMTLHDALEVLLLVVKLLIHAIKLIKAVKE